MSKETRIFECLSCHNKWTTPTLTEQENMRCPECGKKRIVLKGDIHGSVMEIGNDIKVKESMPLEDKKDESDNDCER